jgi:diguanylate cyclase (GGDEF)-like protein
MPAAPLPANEAERLAELRSLDLLDTPPEARFDLFVELAARLYDVPISLITLLDSSRQWFKAGHGVTATETPREMAFCAYAILRPTEVLVVEDARLDPRFIDNPLVSGPAGMRFYAGAPIVTGAGLAMGTLCIIDSEPRKLDERARSQLGDMARGVGSIIELHRTSAMLHRAATRDALTGLANRALFDQRLEQALKQATHAEPCVVALLDLDYFKRVNDTHGHAGGDVVLRAVADRLCTVLRPGDLAARLGGDEFAVLLCGLLPENAAKLFAQRIVAAFAEPFMVGGRAEPIRTSVGYAVAPTHAIDSAGLLLAADIALYRAKAAGRGRFAGASDVAAVVLLDETHAMADDLRAALGRGDLELCWEPYFALPALEIAGYEALLRWTHPTRGVVSPSDFIPVAELSGLITAIDSWVLATACRQAAAWSSDMPISVNLGSYWLRVGDLTGLVADVLRDTGLRASRLVVEITERTVIDESELARERIAELQALGVRVALDDFGTGYSALSCLIALPFNILKLDQALVRNLGIVPRAETVVRSILQLGRGLGMAVCAEGVETPAQLAFLRAEGCDMVQGYLFESQASAPDQVQGGTPHTA